MELLLRRISWNFPGLRSGMSFWQFAGGPASFSLPIPIGDPRSSHRGGRASRKVFRLRRSSGRVDRILLLHLGMTGRPGLLSLTRPPRHMAGDLRSRKKSPLVFEDPRHSGSLQLDRDVRGSLGPEPSRIRSRRDSDRKVGSSPAKNQGLPPGSGGVLRDSGNMRPESLFQSGIHPDREARGLSQRSGSDCTDPSGMCSRAIQQGMSGADGTESVPAPIFYYGNTRSGARFPETRFPGLISWMSLSRLRHPVERIVQAGRSTFFVPPARK